jgi:hypothetical protein
MRLTGYYIGKRNNALLDTERMKARVKELKRGCSSYPNRPVLKVQGVLEGKNSRGLTAFVKRRIALDASIAWFARQVTPWGADRRAR